ncbi:hypothetical protein M5D96_010364, partial [Drosophila gunungcola]
ILPTDQGNVFDTKTITVYILSASIVSTNTIYPLNLQATGIKVDLFLIIPEGQTSVLTVQIL